MTTYDRRLDPGGYALMLMVGPRALAVAMEGDRGGHLSDTATGIADRVIDAADPAERAAMVRAAVDLLARYAVHDAGMTR